MLRRLIENSIASLAAILLLRLSSMALFIVIARKLGEEATGMFSLATTYSLIGTAIAFWGLDQWLITKGSHDPHVAGQYWFNLGWVRLLLSVVTIALFAVLMNVLQIYAPATTHLILLMTLTLIPDSLDDICQAYFIAIEQMAYITLTSFILAIFRVVGIVFILLAQNVTIVTVTWVFLIANLARSLIGAGLVYRKAAMRFTLDWKLCGASLRWAFPFVFINATVILEARLGTVFISLQATEREVGLYSAAMNIVTGLQMLPRAFRTSISPLMSRLYVQDKEAFARLYYRSTLYLLMIAFGIIPIIIIVAPDLMLLLYQAPFISATLSLQLLVISILFRLLNIPSSRLLVLAGRQSLLAWFMVAGLVGNTLVCLGWMPRMGFTAAAVGELVSMGIYYGLSMIVAQPYVPIMPLLTQLGRVFLALALGWGISAALTLTSLSAWLNAGLGFSLYAGGLWVMRAIPSEDVARVRQWLARRMAFLKRRI
ncbi:MAG TPA: oligosaccharide flippase family protein [Anaerolineae bacterium]|nr:oligosaccharide flippase family protein [Anaerolineae bacterium]